MAKTTVTALVATCPHCDKAIAISTRLDDYEWNDEASTYGEAKMFCPKCGKPISVFPERTISSVDIEEAD